jgi:hypothetical protein
MRIAAAPGAAVLLLAGAISAQAPQERVRLAPRFAPGQTLRYQLDSRTTTEGASTGPIQDPNAPTKLEIALHAVLWMEVLAVEPDPSAAGERVRLRTTYEKAAATTRGDTFDPALADIEERYRRLEGRSIEFTLGADGRMQEVAGLREILGDAQAAAAAQNWLSLVTFSASLPHEGIRAGQKWTSEHPIPSAPLAGLVWRTTSTYLRDEPCRSGAPENEAAGEPCAVVLTQFEIAQPRALRDPTPDDFRRAGLRTAGKWSGAGESLSYLSLRTALLVSVTQSGTEEMDLTVSSAAGAASVRYAGRVRTELHIVLLPPPAP